MSFFGISYLIKIFIHLLENRDNWQANFNLQEIIIYNDIIKLKLQKLNFWFVYFSGILFAQLRFNIMRESSYKHVFKTRLTQCLLTDWGIDFN